MMNLIDSFKASLYALFAFLSINNGVIEILFFLMLIDLVLGSVKAVILGRFHYKILILGLVSKLVVISIPLIIALMARALSFDLHYFVVLVFNIIIVSEGVSCVTNILAIKKGKEVKNNDYITMLIEGVRKALQLILERLFSALEKKD